MNGGAGQECPRLMVGWRPSNRFWRPWWFFVRIGRDAGAVWCCLFGGLQSNLLVQQCAGPPGSKGWRKGFSLVGAISRCRRRIPHCAKHVGPQPVNLAGCSSGCCIQAPPEPRNVGSSARGRPQPSFAIQATSQLPKSGTLDQNRRSLKPSINFDSLRARRSLLNEKYLQAFDAFDGVTLAPGQFARRPQSSRSLNPRPWTRTPDLVWTLKFSTHNTTNNLPPRCHRNKP